MSCVWKHIWIWFCERLTLSECHFVVGEKQLKLIFIKCRFLTRWNIHIEFQVLLEKIKPSFPPWIATEQPFQEIVLSSEFLDERSPIFYYCPWALSDCSNVICNSEIKKTSLDATVRFQKSVWFWFLANIAWLFSNAVMSSHKLVHRELSHVGRR